MKNGLLAWYNFLCLVFVAHAHILAEPCGFAIKRFDKIVIPLFSILAGLSWGGFLKKTKGVGFWYGLKMFLSPYVFWSMVYFSLNCIIFDIFVKGNDWSLSVGDIVFYIVTGYSALHLWFLITLVYAIVIVTLLFRVIRDSRIFVVAIVFILLFTMVFPELPLATSCVNRYVEYFNVWFCWLVPGFAIGILLSIPKSKAYASVLLKHWVVPIMLVIGFGWLFFGRYRGVALPAATALALAACAYPKISAPQWLSAITPYVMGIYLVHALFTSAVNVALRLTPNNLISHYLAWPIAVAVFFVAWFAVWVMRKIPVIKNLV